MNLKDRISGDLKTFLKSGKMDLVGVLRLLVSAIHNKAIDKKGKTGNEDLTDEEITQVLMSEAKKRKESIEVFTKGGRADLAVKEKAELETIQKYLPKQMSKEETEKAVTDILAKSDPSDIGSAMKAVMAELRGKADAGMVSEIVKSKLK